MTKDEVKMFSLLGGALIALGISAVTFLESYYYGGIMVGAGVLLCFPLIYDNMEE